MDQQGTWHGGRPQSRRLCVRWGPSPCPKRGPSPRPQFSAHFCCGQTAGCMKMPLGMKVSLSPGDFGLDGDPALLPKNGAELPPQFSVHFLSPNGWVNQYGTWHGGGPWSKPHCARWSPSSPLPKRGRPPIFGPYPLRPNACIDQDATWYGGRPRPRRFCVRWGPRFPSPEKGGGCPLIFCLFIVAKRLDGSRSYLARM